MANLIITTRCNRGCQYCFGGKHTARKDMKFADILKIMDIAVASGFHQVRLLGGEPTLHSDFASILHAAIERDLEILIFSNGLMSSEALEAIMKTPPEKCHVMLNLNINDMPKKHSRISQVAKTLGKMAFISINIYSPEMPLKNASDFAKIHGLEYQIRIGLAHPRLDRQNSYLHPRHYKQVGEEIENFFDIIDKDDFNLNLDCGFVPCMFTPDFLEVAEIKAEELGLRCGPIPDILPDLTSIHCFPLGELDELPISGITTFQEMRNMHEQRINVFKKIGIFQECSQCDFMQNNLCMGGCPSLAMIRSNRDYLNKDNLLNNRFEAKASSTIIPENVKSWSIPYIDQPLDFWETLLMKFRGEICEVYFPLEISSSEAELTTKSFIYLEELLESKIVPMAAIVNSHKGPNQIEQKKEKIIDQLLKLGESYRLKTVTLSDLRLAEMIRKQIPNLHLVAHYLSNIIDQAYIKMLGDLFDILIPPIHFIGFPDRLCSIRDVFPGRILLIVNEFDPNNSNMYSKNLIDGESCSQFIWSEQNQFMCRPGTFILPQHIDHFEPFVDEFKLSDKFILFEPEKYMKILNAYVSRTALWPHEIGEKNDPSLANSLVPLKVFQYTLNCNHVCDHCSVCKRVKDGMDKLRISP